jgi:hypothetical protein
MKNKNLLIGGGVLAVILLFVYFRNRQSSNGEDTMDTRDIDGGLGTSSTSATQPTSQSTTETTKATPTTQLTKFELEARMLKSCGVRPIVKGARRNLYNACLEREKAILRQQGLISFNGMDENSASGLDFDGNIID